MIHLKETATAEFYTEFGVDYIDYNNVNMTLEKFLRLAKKGEKGAIDILNAVKSKMKDYCFQGDIVDFIRNFFCVNNHKLDVIVKDGTYKATMSGEYWVASKPIYDNDELEKSHKIWKMKR